jgi:hypothetical protein
MFLDNVFRAHGLPETIVSDRDPRFTGKFFVELCRLLGVKQSFSSAFHPQTDGQTERANRVMEDVIRHYVAPDGQDWDEHLSLAEFAVNNAYHAAIDSTPFFLNHGQHPRLPGHPDVISKVPRALGVNRRMQELWARAKSCLQAAADRAKAYVDKRRTHKSFRVGDKVLLATKHARPKNVLGRKLLPKWMGPFVITTKVNEVAYQLSLPDHLKWHNVFHVSLLQEYKDGGRVQPPPIPDVINGELEYEVERVLLHRVVGRRMEFLVKWLGYSQEHNSWEPAEAILDNCQPLVSEYWTRKAKAKKGQAKGGRSKSRTGRVAQN